MHGIDIQPPTLSLPHEGGRGYEASHVPSPAPLTPSPLMGEGWGGGDGWFDPCRG